MGTVTCQSPCYGYSDAEPVTAGGVLGRKQTLTTCGIIKDCLLGLLPYCPTDFPTGPIRRAYDCHQSPGATPWRLENRPSLLPLVSSLLKYVCSATQQTSPSHCLNSHLKALEHSPGPPLTLPGPCGAFVLSFVHVQGSGRPPMASLLFLPCLAVCTVDGC